MCEMPLPDMRTAAVATHEMFISYVEAGFTQEQALFLVSQMVIAASRPPEEP